MLTMEINKYHLRALFEVVPKHDVRSYLNGVYVDFTNKCLVATDGHRLLQVPFRLEAPECFVPDPKLPDLIMRLPSSKPNLSDQEDIHITVSFVVPNDKGDEIEAQGEPIWSSVEWRYIDKANRIRNFLSTVVDGRYPDYVRVMPDRKITAKATQFSFNPEYVAPVAKALKAAGVTIKYRSEKPEQKGADVEFMVKAEHQYLLDDVRYVLMLMRE